MAERKQITVEWSAEAERAQMKLYMVLKGQRWADDNQRVRTLLQDPYYGAGGFELVNRDGWVAVFVNYKPERDHKHNPGYQCLDAFNEVVRRLSNVGINVEVDATSITSMSSVEQVGCSLLQQYGYGVSFTNWIEWVGVSNDAVRQWTKLCQKVKMLVERASSVTRCREEHQLPPPYKPRREQGGATGGSSSPLSTWPRQGGLSDASSQERKKSDVMGAIRDVVDTLRATLQKNECEPYLCRLRSYFVVAKQLGVEDRELSRACQPVQIARIEWTKFLSTSSQSSSCHVDSHKKTPKESKQLTSTDRTESKGHSTSSILPPEERKEIRLFIMQTDQSCKQVIISLPITRKGLRSALQKAKLISDGDRAAIIKGGMAIDLQEQILLDQALAGLELHDEDTVHLTKNYQPKMRPARKQSKQLSSDLTINLLSDEERLRRELEEKDKRTVRKKDLIITVMRIIAIRQMLREKLIKPHTEINYDTVNLILREYKREAECALEDFIKVKNELNGISYNNPDDRRSVSTIKILCAPRDPMLLFSTGKTTSWKCLQSAMSEHEIGQFYVQRERSESFKPSTTVTICKNSSDEKAYTQQLCICVDNGYRDIRALSKKMGYLSSFYFQGLGITELEKLEKAAEKAASGSKTAAIFGFGFWRRHTRENGRKLLQAIKAQTTFVSPH